MKKPNTREEGGEARTKTGAKNTQKNPRERKTPKEIVDEHIMNKDDVITEEEFKNLDLNLGVKGDVTHEPLDIPDQKERPKDEKKDKGRVTPWDVIE